MKRIVVLPDVHAPNHEENAFKAVLSFIKEYKPTHLVQLGDFCDWDSVTSYEARREKDITTIQYEVCAANELLDRLQAALPKNCVKFMVGGNHEARYERYRINEAAKPKERRLHEFTSWFDEYRLHDRKWAHCEYGETHEIGKIVFTHGWFVGGSHAQRHLNLWHKSVMYGHTHQFQVATGVGLDGKPVMAASLGTLSRFDLSYLVGKPPQNWLNMFAYVDMREDGTFSPHFVPIINGSFIEKGIEFK